MGCCLTRMRIPLLLLLAAAASHHYGVFVSYYVQRNVAYRVRSADVQCKLFLVSYRPLAKSRWQSFRRSTALPSGHAAELSRLYDSHDTALRPRPETTP